MLCHLKGRWTHYTIIPVPEIERNPSFMSTETHTDVATSVKKILYCPTCQSRYSFEAASCRTCGETLVSADPRKVAYFVPKVDIPLALFAVGFIYGYARLPGEARSFGLIFIIIASFAILVDRTLRHFEWRGRN